jgi:hypothetical protein
LSEQTLQPDKRSPFHGGTAQCLDKGREIIAHKYGDGGI